MRLAAHAVENNVKIPTDYNRNTNGPYREVISPESKIIKVKQQRLKESFRTLGN